jgi:hypothetical protein
MPVNVSVVVGSAGFVDGEVMVVAGEAVSVRAHAAEEVAATAHAAAHRRSRPRDI